ncbi:MAG: cell division protein SepF [Abditibacteriota bacterium]|nr:cell division protein SepF [Abditibacteriota bacterium]
MGNSKPNTFFDLMTLFGGSRRNDADADYDDEDEIYEDEADYDEEEEEPRQSRFVTKTNSTKRTVSVWQTVRTEKDAKLVADGLKQGREQIISFDLNKESLPEQNNILQFLCGVIYAINGNYAQISENVFIFTPSGYHVEFKAKTPYRRIDRK